MQFTDIKGIFAGISKTDSFLENKDLVRRHGADSMVLLKNDGILPLKRSHIALFGAGAIDTIFSCRKIGIANETKYFNIVNGLSDGGFTFSSTTWLEKMKHRIKVSRTELLSRNFKESIATSFDTHPDEPVITKADIAEAVIGADTCIYVIRRPIQHGIDRTNSEGDYLLSPVEILNLETILDAFDRVIILINAGFLEISQLQDNPKVKAIMYMGLPGMEAGHALSDLLRGKAVPSGHLTDTWAKKYKDYPSCATIPVKNDEITSISYKEDIFVGYRYFDSYKVKPLYPFGYGLSYTKFNMELTHFEANWFNITLKIKVTNIGDYVGRQVVQIYVSAPGSSLIQPHQELKGFTKTSPLKTGESEIVEIRFSTSMLASFSEEKNAYIFEKGSFLFRIGDNSVDTSIVARIVVDEETICQKTADELMVKNDFDFLPPPAPDEVETSYIASASLKSEDYTTKETTVFSDNDVWDCEKAVSSNNDILGCEKVASSKASFSDVKSGQATLEDFISSLPTEVLARLVTGDEEQSEFKIPSRITKPQKVPKKRKAAASTCSQYASSLGIVPKNFANGTAKLELPFTETTCYPSPLNMAQTWDKSALLEFGRAYGREMEHFKIDYCLAPALNIHRNPLAGATFSSYSEDPVLSGFLAAAFTKGVMLYEGRHVVLKHLTAFNQFNNALDLNINVSQRALREIYLKSFEICVKKAHPQAIMSSCNRINGEFTSSSSAINNTILRGEWNFKGFVMSDFNTKSDKVCDLAGGCDLIMPGYSADYITAAVRNKRLPLAALQTAAYHILNTQLS